MGFSGRTEQCMIWDLWAAASPVASIIPGRLPDGPILRQPTEHEQFYGRVERCTSSAPLQAIPRMSALGSIAKARSRAGHTIQWEIWDQVFFGHPARRTEPLEVWSTCLRPVVYARAGTASMISARSSASRRTETELPVRRSGRT